MLIAFHTKHIMGAQSVKAGLPLRAGFIELAEQKEGPEKSLQGSRLRGERQRLVLAQGPDPCAPPPRSRVGRSHRLAGPWWIPLRSRVAERMSAQVSTRLCFRHLGTAAGSEQEKVGPVRPLAPGVLSSVQRRRRLRARGARH